MILASVCAPCLAFAQAPSAPSHPGPPAPPAPSWLEGITLNGFAESSFSYDFNRPDSGKNALRVFDFDDRRLVLDVAELVLQHPATACGDLGFRFDAVAGQTIPKVSAASGLFRDTHTGEAHDYDLQQAYATWVAPVGKGLRIDAGKFVTSFGYEVIDGYDGYNDNQTRSFLFGFAIPFTHTGLRASYPITDEVTGSVMVVQGWDDWHDDNDAQSVGLQLALTPTRDWTVWATAMGGPEQKDDVHDDRFLYEVTSTWKATEELTLGLDALLGTEQGLRAGGGSAEWTGGAAYFRRDFSSGFSLALRGEVFDDRDGARTGTRQELKGLTLTPALEISKHCVVRGDLRQDWSDEDVFERRSDLVDSQTTASVALLLFF